MTITIIATLASLIFLMARKGIDSARTSKSVSNLHQFYTGIGSWAAENNMRFPINYKTTVISVDPSKFNAGRTCLIADNSGKTQSLSPDGDNGNAPINARNGASGSFKRDGKAVALFLDGHIETISAQRAKELNNKKDDPFWGVDP